MLEDTLRATNYKAARDQNKSMTVNNSTRAYHPPEKKNLQGNHYSKHSPLKSFNMPSQAQIKSNLAVSNVIGVNTTSAFFSAKNRKIYDIYNTKSIQKKKELSCKTSIIPKKSLLKKGSPDMNIDRLINMSQ